MPAATGFIFGLCAAAALREIRRDPAAAALRAERGARFMKEHFSLENFKNSVDSFLDGRK